MATASLTETEMIGSSTSAGEHFTNAYYDALNGSRNQIASFYVPSTQLPSGRDLPYISYNGEVLNDPMAFQQRFSQMPYTHFEAQSVDVQIMNQNIAPIEGKTKKELEHNQSLLVQISGFVRYHERKNGPMRGFSDSLVLVPNKEEVGGIQTGKNNHGRRWVIQTQNFRVVV